MQLLDTTLFAKCWITEDIQQSKKRNANALYFQIKGKTSISKANAYNCAKQMQYPHDKYIVKLKWGRLKAITDHLVSFGIHVQVTHTNKVMLNNSAFFKS